MRLGLTAGLIICFQANSPLVAQSSGSNAPKTRSTGTVTSQNPELWQVVDSENLLIPQTLLPVIHSEEGQEDLRLTVAEKAGLIKIFEEIDGTWWRSRNLEELERRRVVADLERQLLASFSKIVPNEKVKRLQQLELQAQAIRGLLRSDVATGVKLTERQHDQLLARAQATLKLSQDSLDSSHEKKNDSTLQQRLADALANEAQRAFRDLSETQKSAYQQMLGELIDLSHASRVYPLAPEFAAGSRWLGQGPERMADLRGKVVVVHFYAFQCINCQRNFQRYTELVQRFQDRDVVMIGIQTPELPAERDPEQVRAAAEKHQFTFPVLHDVDNNNWNAWGNTMWPTVYVVDQDGYIRMWWQGELNWQGAKGDEVIANAITRLLERDR